MSTRDLVEQKIEQFKALDLEEKLLFIYSSSLYERYGGAIEREEIEWSYPEDLGEEEIEYQIERGANIRLMELDLTYKEMLFLVKATGVLDALIKKLGNYKQASLLLSLITDKPSFQNIQNQISQTEHNGGSDSDFALSQNQARSLFEKLQVLDDYRLSHLLTVLKDWQLQNSK
jgi:hypothetical protein